MKKWPQHNVLNLLLDNKLRYGNRSTRTTVVFYSLKIIFSKSMQCGIDLRLNITFRITYMACEAEQVFMFCSYHGNRQTGRQAGRGSSDDFHSPIPALKMGIGHTSRDRCLNKLPKYKLMISKEFHVLYSRNCVMFSVCIMYIPVSIHREINHKLP